MIGRPLLLLLLACSAPSAQAVRADAEPPNVLLICVDDLRPELGCYGAEPVQSPRLDELAAEGRVFLRHYVQAPTCGASRYGLLTGRRPTERGQLGNHWMVNRFPDRPEGARPESFVHHFRRHGYRTVGIGKISHQPDGVVSRDPLRYELPHSWDEMLIDPGKWGPGNASFFAYADGSNRNDRDRQVPTYERGEVGDTGYPDGLNARLAVRKLEELAAGEQPFLLAVGFYKPHLPFNAPAKYWDLYARADVPLSPNPEAPAGAARSFVHGSGEFFRNYKVHPEIGGAGKRIGDDYARTVRHAYLAAVSYVDAQIGLVLDALEEQGLADDTVVVVWGDHGWHLGDHTIWGKHSAFERALHSPLIVRLPRQPAPGVPTRALAGSIDVYPTLCELAGLPVPESVDGTSLVPQLHDPVRPTHRPIVGYQPNTLSMRTDRWRLAVRHRDESWTLALFDHEADPLETRDGAAEHPAVVRDLLDELEPMRNDLLPPFDSLRAAWAEAAGGESASGEAASEEAAR